MYRVHIPYSSFESSNETLIWNYNYTDKIKKNGYYKINIYSDQKIQLN